MWIKVNSVEKIEGRACFTLETFKNFYDISNAHHCKLKIKIRNLEGKLEKLETHYPTMSCGNLWFLKIIFQEIKIILTVTGT